METENKEEIIEEIKDTEETITPDTKIDEVATNSLESTPNKENENSLENAPVKEESVVSEKQQSPNQPEQNVGAETNEKNEDVIAKKEKNKKKLPLIIFLVILLIIDIAALVIYLIGIDKVLGFIK